MMGKIKYVFFALIIIGLFLRAVNLRFNVLFDWDQEYLAARPAMELIEENKLTLIGGKASTGGFFVGPLYTYLSALFFFLFKLDPLSVLATSVFIFSTSAIFLFWLLKKNEGTKFALIACLLYCVSPFFLYFDRIGWNMNLMPGAAFLVIIGNALILGKRNRQGFLIAGIGLFLGLNSHPSVLIFIVFTLLNLLISGQVFRKEAFTIYAWILAALFPLILFDFKHSFIITKGLGNFSQSAVSFSLSRIMDIALGLLESQGRLFIFEGPRVIQVMVGLAIFIQALISFRKNRLLYSRIYIVLFFCFLAVSFLYSGPISDYYYLPFLPAAVLLISSLLINYKNNKVILFIAVALLLHARTFTTGINAYSLGYKELAARIIKGTSGDRDVYIMKDTRGSADMGWDYIFQYYRINQAENMTGARDVYFISDSRERLPLREDFVAGGFFIIGPQRSGEIFMTKTVQFYNGLFSLRLPSASSIVYFQENGIEKYGIYPAGDYYLKEGADFYIEKSDECVNKQELLVPGQSFTKIFKKEKLSAFMEIDKDNCIKVLNFDAGWFFNMKINREKNYFFVP